MLARMTSEIVSRPLTFLRRGQPVTLRNVPPDRTLLEVLREDLHLSATKEGCGEGDCGACTVVLGESVDGQLAYRAVNSCIRLAHSVAGMAVFTAEDIAAATATNDNGDTTMPPKVKPLPSKPTKKDMAAASAKPPPPPAAVAAAPVTSFSVDVEDPLTAHYYAKGAYDYADVVMCAPLMVSSGASRRWGG